MTRAVLLVDEHDERCRAVAAALGERGVPVLQVRDAFDAMASLGRADFGALLLGTQRRELTLRGLAQLARRRHPAVRIIMIRPAFIEANTVAATLGVAVDVIDDTTSPLEAAARVITLMSTPQDPFEEPSTAEVSCALHEVPDAAAKEAFGAGFTEEAEPTTPDMLDAVWDAPTFVAHQKSHQAAPSAPRPSPLLREPLLEGVFTVQTGPALLMSIFAQDLTGRLEVSGGAAKGTLYFHRGEPTAADHPEGNEGLIKELESRSLVPAALDIRFVPDGELLSTLVAAGNVTGEAMYAFVAGFVRGRLLELVGQQEGTYRFIEDRRFLVVAPLVRMNPFGIILERRREDTRPDALQAEHDRMIVQWISPRPALRLAAEKLRAFTRGKRVDDVIGSGTSVRAFLAAIGLDELMGALVLATLVDALLVELVPPPTHAPAPAPVDLAPPPPSVSPRPASPQPLEEPSAPESEAARALREEILNLYMRLKPVSHPRQVLGVPVWADRRAAIEAYQRRMRELDPRRIPEGPSRELLLARVEELRAKVMHAMRALQYQGGARPDAPLPDITSGEENIP
jgi:CheY-like chemotaxis protein